MAPTLARPEPSGIKAVEGPPKSIAQATIADKDPVSGEEVALCRCTSAAAATDKASVSARAPAQNDAVDTGAACNSIRAASRASMPLARARGFVNAETAAGTDEGN